MVKTPKVNLPKVKSIPRGAKNVALVHPERSAEGNPVMDSNQTKRRVTELVNTKDDFIRVRNLRKIKNGGIMVETVDKSDAVRIKDNEKLKESGIKATSPKANNPKIMIYVEPDAEFDETCECIWKQNTINRPSVGAMNNGFKLIKEIHGRERNTRHWVVECKPEVRNWLRNTDRIYIEWQACRVKDYADVVRCYKCQGYGHVAKYCREKPTCGHCAGSTTGRTVITQNCLKCVEHASGLGSPPTTVLTLRTVRHTGRR